MGMADQPNNVVPISGHPAGTGDHDDTGAPGGWGTDDNYSIDTFYTRATDAHGHSSYPKFRCPPHLYDRIASLVASRRIPPYSTPHDFVRDAVVHRLHYVERNIDDLTLRDDISHALAYEEQRHRADSYTRVVDEHLSYARTCREVATKATDLEDWIGLRALAGDMRVAADNMRAPFDQHVIVEVEIIEAKLREVGELD